MKFGIVAVLLATVAQTSEGFSSFTGTSLNVAKNSATMTMEYIPR